ncbi:MAG TPA: hypothetical protein VMK42_03100 [Anaeromyxobacteraceae bacterium]|nr:hypothetical protein [Anaeromyxobacteraceae bacterium]
MDCNWWKFAVDLAGVATGVGTIVLATFTVLLVRSTMRTNRETAAALQVQTELNRAALEDLQAKARERQETEDFHAWLLRARQQHPIHFLPEQFPAEEQRFIERGVREGQILPDPRGAHTWKR